MRRDLAYLAALGIAALLACPGVVSGATPSGAVISNGTVQLGVTQWGDLNYDCDAAADTGCPGQSGTATTSVVGLRYVPLNTEATADGCPCEGWGVADATSGLAGYADEAQGTANVTPVGIMATATTAVVTSDVSDAAIPGYSLRVVHDYHPSRVSPNLYEATVSITNTGDQPVDDLRYRRAMDWDIEPTPFNEWVTIAHTSASRQLLFDSDQGFEAPNPLGPRSYSQSENVCGAAYTGRCDFTDLGAGGEYPASMSAADHGALFDFGFGALAPGRTRVFEIYYGAAPSEAAALSAIATQGIGVYSLGESDCGNSLVTDLCAGLDPFAGVEAGLPNTFTFGFLTADADLSVVAGPPPPAVLTGGQAAVSFTVKNNGPDATPGARLVITLPEGTDYVSAVPSQGSCTYTASDIICSFGALANGASATVVVRTLLARGGTFTLTAALPAASDGGSSNDAASVALIASDVLVTVIPAPPAAPPAPGAPFKVQVQFRIPASCATPCLTDAKLTLRDGTTVLGSRDGLSLTGSGHARFNVSIDKAALQAADGIINLRGYRTTQTRMTVRTLGTNGSWSNVVKLGHISVSVDRMSSGGLPRVVGKVF